MHHELLEAGSARDAAQLAATVFLDLLADQAASTVSVALSGGSTPAPMFEHLAATATGLDHWRVFQVDERVAPTGDPARNLNAIEATLGTKGAQVVAMPVEGQDLDDAAAAYAELLPLQFDVLHLGIGSDGHTASLLPGDAALDDARLVAPTSPYQGHRRLTLTYPALARAKVLLWLVAGADKAEALRRLLAGDAGIPAGRVVAGRSIVVADQSALAGVLRTDR